MAAQANVGSWIKCVHSWMVEHRQPLLIGTAATVGLVLASYLLMKQYPAAVVKRGISFRALLKEPSIEERAQGILLGTAVGDAKGTPFESMTRAEIAELVGRASPRGSPYCPVPETNRLYEKRWPPGRWTDDTQLTLAIVNAIIQARGVDLSAIEKEHVKAYHAGTDGWGGATLNAVARLAAGTHTYFNSGEVSTTGNGVVMKIAPVALLYSCLGQRKSQLEKDREVEAITRMTHNNAICVVGSLLHVRVLERIFAKRPEFFDSDGTRKSFLLEAFRDAQNLEREYKIEPVFSTRIDQLVQQFGVLTDEVILRIANGGQPGNVADSLALVYGLFAQRSPSFGTVLKAATIGGDTDTHAAIIGAMIGGLKGKVFIPKEYIEKLYEGEQIAQAGKIFARILDDLSRQ